MNGYELYVFLLCFIVFAVFAGLSIFMIYTILQLQLKLMKHGLSDEVITKEYEKEQNESPAMIWATRIFSWLMCLVFAIAFMFSLWLNANADRPANGIPSIKVIKSGSMATKHEANTYLTQNGLDNQLQMFDLVVCSHLPAEEDLELYDIVVYKKDDYYVIHRIIGIEEPNENHPNERHFLTKGDANKYEDEFPVLYSQMRGIYKGIRIPYIGSFVLFLQSPAGWLVILLVLFAVVGTPLVENKWKKARTERLIEIGVIIPEPEEPAAEMETENSEHEAEEAGEPESDQIEAETSEQTGVRL
jgi:signal peptidase I